jgi:predicted transcriptional regulator
MSENRKRSDLEITTAILHVAVNGAKKSHIIYKANLNFKLGKKYLTRLIKSGLIDGPATGRRVFSTTEKGVAYLKYVDGFKQFLPSLDVGTPVSS